jgi:N12 class adenine-specific DNA methylase
MNLLDLIRGMFRGKPPAKRPENAYTKLAESLRNRATLLENAPYDGGGWVNQWLDIFQRFRDDEPLAGFYSTYANRKWGKNYPIFQTEQELMILRAPSRVLAAANSYAIGMMRGLTAYTIGKGFDYKVVLRDEKDHEHTPLVTALNALLDAFHERNQWHGGEQPPVESEFFQRSIVDGEGIICHWNDPDPRYKGGIVLRFVEPEQLTMPPGKSFEEWGFGIGTPADDAQNVQGYYFYWGMTPAEGEYYYPHQVTHYRRNSWRTVKRGLPDFTFSTEDSLNTADRLRRNMGRGASIQSAIAGVREHTGATGDQMQAMQNLLSRYFAMGGSGAMGTNGQAGIERFDDGTILDVNENEKWIDGPSAGNSSAYVSILSACIAGATARWNAPSWLATSDGSNMGAYTAALVEESPFVKGIQCEQLWYSKAFLRSHWLAIETYVKAHGGVIEVPKQGKDGSYTTERYNIKQIKRLVDIQCEPPSVQTRNKAEEATTALSEIQAKTLSVQQWCQSQGRDYEQTMANIAEHDAKYGPKQQPASGPMAGPAEEQPEEQQPGTEQGIPIPSPEANGDGKQPVGGGENPAVNPLTPAALQESAADVRTRLAAAAATVEPNPTEAQRKAGTYRHGHCRIHGLPITLEVAKGGWRRGKDPSGKDWQIKLPHHYGYLKRFQSAADSEHVDCFIGPDPESELVFVADQQTPEGVFDEHKILLGFTSQAEARQGYLDCYEKGWKGLAAITPLTLPEFKAWLEHGDTSRPVGLVESLKEPAKVDAILKKIAKVVKSLNDNMGYGEAWYEPKLRTVWVSVGDWDEDPDRYDVLKDIDGVDDVRVEAEFGPGKKAAEKGEEWLACHSRGGKLNESLRQPDAVHARAATIFESMREQRQLHPDVGWGTDDPAEMQRLAYTQALRESWDENKHHRNHGQFAASSSAKSGYDVYHPGLMEIGNESAAKIAAHPPVKKLASVHTAVNGILAGTGTRKDRLAAVKAATPALVASVHSVLAPLADAAADDVGTAAGIAPDKARKKLEYVVKHMARELGHRVADAKESLAAHHEAGQQSIDPISAGTVTHALHAALGDSGLMYDSDDRIRHEVAAAAEKHFLGHELEPALRAALNPDYSDPEVQRRSVPPAITSMRAEVCESHHQDGIAAPLAESAPVTEQTDDGQHLAQWFADLFTGYAQHGEPVPQALHDLAEEELDGGHWFIGEDGDHWLVHHTDEVEQGEAIQESLHLLEARRKPGEAKFTGSRTIRLKNGKTYERHYVDGKQVKGPVVPTAARSPAINAKTDVRTSRGSVDTPALHAKLNQYQHPPELAPSRQASSRRAFGAIKGRHGTLTLHRLDEMHDALQKQLKAYTGNSTMQEFLSGKLADLNHMLGLAKEHGITGQVSPEEQQAATERLAARKPTPDTEEAPKFTEPEQASTSPSEPAAPTITPDTTPEEPTHADVARAERTGDSGGLSTGQPVGTDAGTHTPAVPAGPDSGTGSQPSGVPAHQNDVGDGTGHATGGAGDGSAHGAGTGDAGTPVGPVEESLAEPPTPENPTDVRGPNWRYLDKDFATGGQKAKFNNNIAAIKALRLIREEGRDTATPAEQATISKFVGWGQFPALFNDYNDYTARKEREAEDLQDIPYEETRKWDKEREQLKSLLTDAEYAAARKSTLNAHYTHPDVVKAHWEMAQKLGFKGSGQRFLETSAGIGYYMGLMPDELAGTKTTAVELDDATAAMLKMLYPRNNIQHKGFQDAKQADNFFDLVASNVPFGNYAVHDPKYNKHGANIHDYFFLKSADLAREGGLVMHITSTGTLDKPNSKIREELAKTCDFVAAIRFPGGAHKENAGTEVVTDMVILRKRPKGEAPVHPTETPPEAMPKASGIEKLKHGDTVITKDGVVGKLVNSEGFGSKKYGVKDSSGVTHWTSDIDQPGFTGTTVDSLGRLYHWVDGKRVPGPDWTKTTLVKDPAGGEDIPVNQYFADHPEQILGTLDRTGTMYKGNSVNVSKTDDYEARLRAAIDRLPADVMKMQKVSKAAFVPDAQPAPGDVKIGGYTVKDGKLYLREGDNIIEQKETSAAIERIAAHLGVRDALRAVVNDETNGRDATDNRKKLNEAYDAFVKKYKALHDKANMLCFKGDPDAPTLLALENYDPKTKVAKKADIFSKNTIRHVASAESASDIGSALGISLHETGGLNIDRMAALLGKSRQEVAALLEKSGIAFLDPSEGWKPADQYLSGNVRKKLVMARAAAEADPKFRANVKALEKMQPEDVDHTEIEARLGSPWIPPSDIKDFAGELLGVSPNYFNIDYVPATGEWIVGMDKKHQGILYGTKGKTWCVDDDQGNTKADLIDVLHAALNNKTKKIYYEHDKGEKAVVNQKATEDMAALVQTLREQFQDEGAGWIWEDDERRERLHRFYNDNFNNIRPMEYDGSHQTFPGMNASIELRDPQKNFIWQVVTTGSGLAAHEVGAGKTYSMIASAMELKRLGLAKKPCIACMKANVEAITADALKLYPGARVLSTADMFDAKSRRQTIAKIATGDYDMIIMTHEHLNLLQMKPDTVREHIEGEIGELTAAILASEKNDPSKGNQVVKKLEKAKLRLEAKLAAALDASKKDNAVFFEETGIDQIFVDEAHNFKSLPVYTAQDRVKGIPTGRSQRATDMRMRAQYLQKQNNGRGVVFATGTPITNTMAELYNMQRYLQPDELKERGIEAFDAWAKTFGEMDTKMELSATGEYKEVSRFAKFVNIPELLSMSRQVFDVQRIDTAKNKDGKLAFNIVRPKRKDQVNTAPKTPAMEDLMARLQARAEKLKGQRPGESTDNMLVICMDGRKGATDMRLLNADAPDEPESKTNRMIANVLKISKEHPGKTQCIFSDLGVHPMKKGEGKADDEAGDSEPENANSLLAAGDTRFHLYGDIIAKLVKGGIPREKIADFSTLKGVKKEEAMEALKKGEMLVALGSTKKLGTGVNIQNQLVALHHLDTPADYTPAGVEQRNGRGWRHGNDNKDLQIHTYVTEGSLDQFTWQLIANKDKFIKQFFAGSAGRAAEDSDAEELSPEQFMAAASGDPRILEQVNLKEEVRKLRGAQNRHEREQRKMKDLVKDAGKNVPVLKKEVENYDKVIKHFEKHPDFSLTVDGQHFDERPKAGEAFAHKIEAANAAAGEAAKKIERWDYRGREKWEYPLGTYRGMEVVKKGIQDGEDQSRGSLFMKTPDGEYHAFGPSLGSLEYNVRQIPKFKAATEERIDREEKGAADLKKKFGAAFPKEEELKTKQERLDSLEGELKGAAKEESNEDRAERHRKVAQVLLSAAKNGADSGKMIEALNKHRIKHTIDEARDIVTKLKNEGRFKLQGGKLHTVDEPTPVTPEPETPAPVATTPAPLPKPVEPPKVEAPKPPEPAPHAGPYHYDTPFGHNDLIGKFGGKRVKRAGEFTTEFPSKAKYDEYKAHVKAQTANKPIDPAAHGFMRSKYNKNQWIRKESGRWVPYSHEGAVNAVRATLESLEATPDNDATVLLEYAYEITEADLLESDAERQQLTDAITSQLHDEGGEDSEDEQEDPAERARLLSEILTSIYGDAAPEMADKLFGQQEGGGDA